MSRDVDPYVYPDTNVIRNRLGITDADLGFMKKKTLSDDCLNQQQEKLKNRQKEPPWRGSALFLEGFLGRPLGLRQLFQELFGRMLTSSTRP